MSEHEEMEDGVSENRSSLHQATDCYIKNREFHFHDPSSLLRPSFMQAPVQIGPSKRNSKQAVRAQKTTTAVPLKGNHRVLTAKGHVDTSASKPPTSSRRQEASNSGMRRSESSATKKEMDRAETAKLRASRDKRKLERAKQQAEQPAGPGKAAPQVETRRAQRMVNQIAKSKSAGNLAVRRPMTRSGVDATDLHNRPTTHEETFAGIRRSGQIHER